MRNDAVLSQTFQERLRANRALLVAAATTAAQGDVLRRIADDLDLVSALIDYSSPAVTYSAYADLIRITAQLSDWRAGLINAVEDVDRFLRAANERSVLWLKEYQSRVSNHLTSIAEVIQSVDELAEVEGILQSIAAVPLPVAFFAADVRRMRFNEERSSDAEAPAELTVAFLQFLIDGSPATDTHFLQPLEAHDLDIEVRVTRWPDDAESLHLDPVSIESPATYEFPQFRFSKPPGEAPYVLRDRGRAILKAAQSLHARPFEFKYAAQFFPQAAEQPVAVVGHRTLRIEGIDVERAPITGYRDMDRKLIVVRNQLRAQGTISAADLNSCLKIMTPLCNLACRTIQDGLFPGVISEAEFQREIRAELRRDAAIGSNLEEHPHAGGGITDLSLDGVRIELKVEPEERVRLDDCETYLEQTSSYIVGTGKRVGVLCVLDCSAKESGPYPAEEGLGVLLRKTNDGVVSAITLIIQSNFPPPSHHSR